MNGREPIDHDFVRELSSAGWRGPAIAAYIGAHPRYINLILSGAVRRSGEGGSKLSRFSPMRLRAPRRPTGRGPMAADDPAMIGMRTRFPNRVREVGRKMVLQSGHNSGKIGGKIMKGRWKWFPVYMLALEERATCPADCALLAACYGNNMSMAVRHRHGDQLEARLALELAVLADRYPLGFAVRLHMLGDFYSVEYVRFWGRMLRLHRALHVFGFTARWDDEIGLALRRMVDDMWSRFAIRFSGAPTAVRSTVVIDAPPDCPHGAIICPQEQGKTDYCATCALCWQSEKQIAFIKH